MPVRGPALCFVLGLALLLPAGARALPNQIVNDRTGDPVAQAQQGPQVAMLGDAIVVLWYEATGAPLQFFQYAYSTDGGVSFTDGGVPPFPIGWRWRLDPSVAFDPGTGDFYVCGQITKAGRWGVGFVRGKLSGGVVVWGAPTTIEDLEASTSSTVGNVAMTFDEVGGRIVVAYSTEPRTPYGLFVRTSVDGGGTWSAAIQLDNPNVQESPAAVEATTSADGVVIVSWAAADVTWIRKMRVWPSGDPGFAPVTTVVSRNGAPPHEPPGGGVLGEVVGWPYVSQSTDCSAGPYRGRTYIAWDEPFEDGDVTFPPVTEPSLLHYVESEPNDTAYVLLPPLQPGAILRGVASSTSPIDADWYVFSLQGGKSLTIWPDSLPASWLYDLRVIAPDGVQRLTGQIGNSGGSGVGTKLGFIAPVDGIYYLRFAPLDPVSATPTGYRIRTNDFALAPGLARDQGDVAVIWSDDGTTWSAPLRVNLDSPGFHAFRTEVAAGFDGTPYLSWFDYSQSTYGGLSHRVIARSLDGGATWTGSANLSDTQTDWTAVLSSSSSKLGFTAGLAAQPSQLRAAWTDGRLGDPDIYTTSFPTGLLISGCPNTVSAEPGDEVLIPFSVTNKNALFENTVHYKPSIARAWPTTEGEVVVAAGASSNLEASIAVPDSATPGEVEVCLNADIDGASPVQCCFALKVTAPLSVKDAPAGSFGIRLSANPVRGTAEMLFALPAPGHVRLTLFGARGERVRVLVDGRYEPGAHRLTWDGRDAANRETAPGIYFARLEWEGHVTVLRFARVN